MARKRRFFGRKARLDSAGNPIVEFSPTITQDLRFYGFTTDYATIYRHQPAVYTVVDFLARNIAQLNLKAYRRISRTEREDASDHPVARLLRSPNPDTTRTRMMHGTVSDLAVFGNAYWLKQRQGSQRSLIRIPPNRITPEPGGITASPKYRLADGQLIDRREIVHFRSYDPTDPRVGMSPLEPLRRILAEEFASSHHREAFWRNAARQDGVIERPVEAGQWSNEARDRFRQEWQAKMSGQSNAGKTAILEDGMKWNAAAFSPKEAEYIEGRKLTREEVAAAYHVSPAMIGILEHANFANIDMQHRMLYQDTLGPWLAELEDEIMLQLVADFSDTDDLYVEFNIEEKLQGSFEEQAKVLTAAVGGPWMLREEARALRNLPPLQDQGTDQLILPLNVMLGGQPAPNVEPERRAASLELVEPPATRAR